MSGPYERAWYQLLEIRKKAVPQAHEAESRVSATLYYRLLDCWVYWFQHQKERRRGRRRKKTRRRRNDSAVD